MSRARRAPFARIFVPVDGGRAALAALRGAARLARASRARLRACYVVDEALIRTPGGIVDVREPLREELQAEGRRALGRAERLCAKLGVPCSVALVEGGVVEALLQEAGRFRADLIVVVKRVPTGLRALLRGSRVPALVEGARCPVLLLPEPPARRRPAKG